MNYMSYRMLYTEQVKIWCQLPFTRLDHRFSDYLIVWVNCGLEKEDVIDSKLMLTAVTFLL